MKRIILNIIALGFIFSLNSCADNHEMLQKRKKHEEFLKNSPFSKTQTLSENQRRKLGIPPDRFLERQWELTMNPELGRPTTEKLFKIQEKLIAERKTSRSVPGTLGNDWVERGPNNVGGRTKAVLFDPNDATHKTVFAGGISGGLWKNTDITNPNSAWTLVDIPENLAVSSITVDPNNSQIFYVGTGESYTGGRVNGNGIWKSSDGGNTWQHVFGGANGEATYITNAKLTINSPAGIAGDYDAIKSKFGPDFTSFSGNLVLVNPSDACSNLTNPAAINGNIAVIQRGTCYFTDKVMKAQNAGATGVLMINNVDGKPIIMGGTNASINIPAVMISKTDGAGILAALNNSETVTATINRNNTVIAGAYVVPGITHINDIIARNNNGTTEIYATAGDTYYSEASVFTVMGTGYQGLYKSTDNGATWNRVNLPRDSNGHHYTPNDLELGADNKIWLTTTTSPIFGKDGAGTVLSSSDGNTFSVAISANNAGRTEIAASKTTPDKLYLLIVQYSNNKGLPYLYKTTDGFTNISALTIPNGNSTPANDFTNGQSYYDLAIEVDPSNDETVYVGGIDWFKSTNGGNSWSQISYGYGGGSPNIHPDQHGIAFADSNHILFACDGGIAYSGDGGSHIAHRNKNYNTVQFYHMAVAPTTALAGEYFMAGAQDNGTHLFENAPAGISGSVETQGGDGAYCFFDQDGTDKYRISNYVYNKHIKLYNYNTGSWKTLNAEYPKYGDFINQEALDSHLNILYSNYSIRATSGNTYRLRRYSNLLGNVQKTTIQNAAMNDFPTALKVSPYTTNSSKLFVGLQNGKLFRVDNANTNSYTFTEITGNQFLGSISDIEFGQSENEIFVTMFNYGVNNIFYTTDGGTTWVEKDANLPDIPVNCILQNPLNTNQVVIGTDLGTWWTANFNNATPYWRQAYNGMKSVKVTDLEMRNDHKVFASTYGRGVFSGQFTAGVPAEVAEINKNMISVYPNPSNGIINIKLPKTVNRPGFDIYDLNGKLIYQHKINKTSKNYKLDLHRLSKGNYILKVQAEQIIYSSKIIIK